MSENNQGIHNTGTFTAGNVVIGSDAQIKDSHVEIRFRAEGPAPSPEMQEVLRLLVRLSEGIDSASAHLPFAKEAAEAAAELRSELERPAPQAEKTHGLLARLVEGVRPVGELAALAATVGEVIRTFPFFTQS